MKNRRVRWKNAQLAKLQSGPVDASLQSEQPTPIPAVSTGEFGGRAAQTVSRLERKAIVERWPVSEEYRAALVKGQVLIALGKGRDDEEKLSARDRTRAFQAIVGADKVNVGLENGSSTTVNTQVNVGAAPSVQDIIQSAIESGACERICGIEDGNEHEQADISESGGDRHGGYGSNGHSNGESRNGCDHGSDSPS